MSEKKKPFVYYRVATAEQLEARSEAQQKADVMDKQLKTASDGAGVLPNQVIEHLPAEPEAVRDGPEECEAHETDFQMRGFS